MPSKISKQEIEKKLEGYKKIDKHNLQEINLGTLMRYYSIDKKGKETFKFGGVLVFKNNDYIRLKNPSANITWSVQLKNITKLFYKDFVKERKREHKIIKNVKEVILKNKNNPVILTDSINVLGGNDKIRRNIKIINKYYDGDIENLLLENKELKKKYSYLLSKYKEISKH